jgi:CubicO group peptidase (beta-lactamase class C family)
VDARLAALTPGFEDEVSAWLRAHPAPGVAAGVVVDGALAWSFGDGFADVERGTVPDDRTPFRVASVTKTFTATALGQLRDDGALSFDDPLVDHLPELKSAIDPFGPIEDVTLRLLLTHRSGLTAEPPLLDWRARRFPSIEETLRAADRIEVVVPPGSVEKYSNLGFQLLGEVVARASGRSFRGCVRERLLVPLGMAETGFDPPAGASTGYDRHPFADAPNVSGGRTKPTDAEGGLWSTVGDLARWLWFQIAGDPSVIRAETLAEIHRPAIVMGQAWTSGQGLAWHLDRRAERVYVGHAGGTPGFSARIAFSPADRIGVVVLANGPATVTDLAFTLADPLVDAVRARPPRTSWRGGGPVPVPEEVRDYLGVYAWPAFDETLRVEWREGALTLVWAVGDAPNPVLEPTAEPGVYRIEGGRETGERCRFVRDGTGRVIGADVAGYPLEKLRGVAT